MGQKWWLLVGILAVPRAAHAYRPFDGTDADVAETGTIELEIGPLQAERANAQTTYTPGGVFNYGVAEGFELVADLDGIVQPADVAGHDGFLSDVLVKHVFRNGSLQEGSGPSVALETGLLLPGVPRHDGDGAGWIADLIVSQRWSVLTLHVNATAFYGRDHQLGGFASTILEGPSLASVRPVAELLAERQGNGTNVESVLAGVIYQRSKTLAFDGAALLQRDAGEQVVAIRIGLTWAFEL